MLEWVRQLKYQCSRLLVWAPTLQSMYLQILLLEISRVIPFPFLFLFTLLICVCLLVFVGVCISVHISVYCYSDDFPMKNGFFTTFGDVGCWAGVSTWFCITLKHQHRRNFIFLVWQGFFLLKKIKRV